mmetsp:Transcript_12020/g.28734  ORF Transcript_12020/g.28734 Transcript_12020/m.28734 type:complete len:594 (+) Transcript_12020:260-2041(+)
MTAVSPPSRSVCPNRLTELQNALQNIVAAARQLGPAAEATLGNALLDAGSSLVSQGEPSFDCGNEDLRDSQNGDDVWLDSKTVRGKEKRIALADLGTQAESLGRGGRSAKLAAGRTSKIAKLSSTRVLARKELAVTSFDNVLMRKDLGFLIFRYLGADALGRVLAVCRCWRKIGQDERLWMWLYISSGLTRPAVVSGSWREDFVKQKIIEHNWTHGRYSVTRLVGHREAINCVAFCNQVLVSGADDNELRVWDLATPGLGKKRNQSRALVGHQGKVLCCCIVRGMAVSGGEDKLVILWDLKTGTAIAHLKQHSLPVLCMVTDGERFVYTGSADQEVVKWDTSTRSCVRVLKSHRGAVLCLSMGPGAGRVISGGRDRDVRVWDTDLDADSTFTLSGHDGAVTCLSAEGNVIASGSDDKFVRVWSSLTGFCLKVIGEHEGPLSAVRLAGPHVLSGSFDGRIRLFEILTGSLLKSMTGHRNAVLALDVQGRICVSGGNDRDVRVWDLSRTDKSEARGGKQRAGRAPDSVLSAGRRPVGLDAAAVGSVPVHGYALQGHNSGVQAVALVRDNYIISASDDYELRVWDFGDHREREAWR